jgi:hypothetical protein
MNGLLAAAQPVRPIVIERGGTPWWVPLLIALGVALVAAAVYIADLGEMPRETSATTHWLTNAVANVRDAHFPHLAAPQFIPRRTRPGTRSFPTTDELSKMNRDREGRALIDELVAWRATGQTTQG